MIRQKTHERRARYHHVMKRLYDLALMRHNRRVDRVQPVTRTLDLDDQTYVDQFDSLLADVLLSLALREAGDRRELEKSLHEFDLEVREHGEYNLKLTFHAVARDLPGC